jgi:NhaC family Na+:H+ antiporter
MENVKEKSTIKPSTAYAIASLIGVLVIILGFNQVLKAPIHCMFFVVWLFVIPVCMHLGYSYNEINDSMMESCKNGLSPILLLLAVGAIISTWIACGAVPGIIYFGLQIIKPEIFLLATFILCGMVSLASGTSWATAGTAGIAMYAIGESLSIPAGMTVGAIISGAFLGDMLSPMSDSTNVAAASVEIELITHCKQLVRVVIPTALISAVIYYFLGLQFATDTFDNSYILAICNSLEKHFSMGFIAFVPVVVLLSLLIFKWPTIPSMLISALAGAATAVLYQGVPYQKIMLFFWKGYSISTGEKFLDNLLNRGGITSMFTTGAMMLFAFGMIGAFSKTGILDAIIEPVVKKINSVVKLDFVAQLIATIGNMMGTNTFALLMTGSLMGPVYKKFGLHPVNCSKTINATSTVIAPLIPWNISSMYVAGLFGVNAFVFAPYSFICYITPIVAFVMVVLNIDVVPANVDLEHGEKYVRENKNRSITKLGGENNYELHKGIF